MMRALQTVIERDHSEVFAVSRCGLVQLAKVVHRYEPVTLPQVMDLACKLVDRNMEWIELRIKAFWHDAVVRKDSDGRHLIFFIK